MIEVRWATERGITHLDWLKSYHSFSFGDYYDQNHMGFRSLRVINEDRVTAGSGFPFHSHKDMEIITYVLAGALEHKDSLGNGSVIRSGDMQRMTAGSGITHSEFNPSKEEQVHFLQIWIIPNEKNLAPSYEQKSLELPKQMNNLSLAVAPTRGEAPLSIHQDARIYVGKFMPHQKIKHQIGPGRNAWLQVGEGAVRTNGHALMSGDGAAISGQTEIEFETDAISQILLFDLL
jgi:redox-sensitive bicupin YhaK (pirin superfamily)